MRETKFRYQLQISTPDQEGWVNQPSGASVISNHPDNLSDRFWRLIVRGKATLDTVRIWDNQENTAVNVPLSCPVNPAHILERNNRLALRKTEQENHLAQQREASEISSVFYQVEQELARQVLAEAVLETADQFNELPELQRRILVGDIAEAYQDTDIDGYGDEGEGYNVDKFTQKLFDLGWKYDPSISFNR